ncbi:MAG: AMP-binding protein [Pseudomonadota bacterium]
MSDYYDELETRDPEQRRQALFSALPKQLEYAKNNAPAYAQLLADINPAEIKTPEALAQLPVTRKSSLLDMQRDDPPFGGLATIKLGEAARVFASPGPIYEPQTHDADYWRVARAMYAAGFRAGDLIHNCYAYHFTPAGAMMESGAHALGCSVFPAGTGQTELQVEAIAALKPTGYAGTPSFLNIILDKAAELQVDVSSLKKGLVSGEALPPSLRQALSDKGIDVLQSYGTADLGTIAYESPAREGMIVDEGIILEIVRPGTGDPVAEGEVGEVIVTTFNTAYPLVRFATGDLSAIMPGMSPCGRTNSRIQGWMGRADQTTKVRGMFVHPEQIADVVKRHPEIIKGRLIIDRNGLNDIMQLQCEVEAGGSDSLAETIRNSIRDICKLRGDVIFVESGSLANDGMVIEDVRTYE